MAMAMRDDRKHFIKNTYHSIFHIDLNYGAVQFLFIRVEFYYIRVLYFDRLNSNKQNIDLFASCKLIFNNVDLFENVTVFHISSNGNIPENVIKIEVRFNVFEIARHL